MTRKRQHPIFQISQQAFIAGAALFSGLAWSPSFAQGVGPISITTETDWLGKGELNHWYVVNSSTSVWAGADGIKESEDYDVPFLGLARTVGVSATTAYSNATAFASVVDGKLRAASQALSGTLDYDPTVASAAVAASYFMVLEQPGSVSVDLRLTGRLWQNGNAFLKESAAGFSVSAFGSSTDMATFPVYDETSGHAGNGVNAFIPKAAAIDTVHAQVFGERLIAGDVMLGDSDATFDRDFSVTANSVAFACGPAPLLNKGCGKYGYYFNLSLLTVALNGGEANFSHTLEIIGLHVPDGVSMTFDAGQAVPVISATSAVSEASTLAMTAASLALLMVGMAARQKREV